MSLGDYLLPWKAIPNMIKDVKDASKTEGKGKHDSIFGAIGKYADPGGALLGDNWMEFWHEKVPRGVNRALEPVGEFHRKYLDPIAMATPEDSKAQKVPDFVQAKGGDSLAAVLGSIYGIGALLGSGAGAGAGAGGGAGGTGSGAGGFFGQGGAVNPWQQAMGQAGSALSQAGQAQDAQQQQMIQQMSNGAQQGAARQLTTQDALQAVLVAGAQARNEDELAEILAALGEPPGMVQAAPQVANYIPPQQAQKPPPPGTVPHTPLTRGEAQTNPSLGSMLLG